MRLSRIALLPLALLLASPPAAAAAPEARPDAFQAESPTVVRRFEQQAADQPMPAAIAQAQLAANPPVCEGDGTTGKRVEVLYLYNTGKPSRLATFAPSLRAMLSMVDDVFDDSARKYGESRHIRFVTEPDDGGACRVAIREIGLAPNVIGDAGATKNALTAMGYNKPGRDYLMLGDPKVADGDPDVCGATWGDGDDRPGPENRFNTGPYYARIDHLCWGSNAIAHELGHAFGAVLAFAPHHDGGGHCNDEWDLMCYGPAMNYPCTAIDADRLLDCNGDDYFNPTPAAGSPLATHWNVANNQFLIRGPAEPAHGLQTGDTYALVNAATSQALTVVDDSTAEWARLSLRPRTDAASQRWTLDYATGYRLLNNGSGLCVESIFSGTTPGTEVMQYRCHEGNASLWTTQPTGNGRFALLHNRSGLALTAAGTGPAVLQPYTGAANQQWTFTKLPATAPTAGATYHLRAYPVRDGSVDGIDVQGGSTQPGALVVRTTPSTAAGQRWKLASAAAGHWTIANAASGLCLRPRGGSTSAGAQLEQWTCDGGLAEQWRLERAEDGRYMVFNRATGFALKLPNVAGSPLVVQPATGDAAAARAMILWLKPA